MRLATTIRIYAGGPGSGRHATAVKDNIHRPDVEMVSSKDLEPFMEFDRRKNPAWSDSKNYMDEMKDEIKKNGIKNPLILLYDHAQGKASLGNGNHRLAVALELGIKEVPVRVVSYKVYHRGVKVPGFKKLGRVPGVMKPSQIGLVGHLAARGIV